MKYLSVSFSGYCVVSLVEQQAKWVALLEGHFSMSGHNARSRSGIVEA